MENAMLKMAAGLVHPVIDREIGFDGIGEGRWNAWKAARSSARSCSGSSDGHGQARAGGGRFSSRRRAGLKKLEYWLVARLAMGALWICRLLPAERALSLGEWVARRIGPLFGRNRVALANLRAAYPEKPEEEIQRIASEHVGPHGAPGGRVHQSGGTLRLRSRQSRGEPHRGRRRGERFSSCARRRSRISSSTAHMGNFELLRSPQPVSACPRHSPLPRPPTTPIWPTTS